MPEAFGFMRALGQQAVEALMRSGQDPNRFIVLDPDTETRLMQANCPPDEPTSLTFIQTRGTTVRVRIGVLEAQNRVGFVSSKFATNTNEPVIPGIAFEADCDLVDVQYAEAQPMWRSSRNARFRPLGKRVIMRNEAPLRFKDPGSPPTRSSLTGQVRTTKRVTAVDRRRGRFGIRLATVSMPRQPSYGKTRFYYGGVYRFTSKSGRQTINPGVTAPVHHFSSGS